MSKEGFSYGEKLFDYKHWINGGRFKSALFTDHKNILAYFVPDARPPTTTKSNHKRMDRWAERLMTLRYLIFHIDGEDNRLADLGSRWGNRFAKTKLADAQDGWHPIKFLRALTTTVAGRRSDQELVCV